jgi:hypothetical protein
MDYGFIYRPPGEEKAITVSNEYGSTGNIRLANNVRSFDGEGKEIIEPVCELCGLTKCRLMGSYAYIYICTLCGK